MDITPSPNSRQNPYVGPRAFEAGEQLYGRDREISELLNLLIAERIVLLYSPSGAGKTSLLRAGLIPLLQREGFYILPTVRVSQEPIYDEKSQPVADGGNPKVNRYVFSVLLSLEEDLPAEQQMPVARLATLTIAEYLKQRPRPDGEEDGRTSEVLIFDQFEEILTIDPTNQEDKSEFFAQIGAALRDRQRWALFSIREDYVGALDPYIRPIPTRMSNRYRLDLLGPQTARRAIQSPAREMGVDFHDSAAQKLVDDLRRVQVQQPDGSMQETLGAYVEPVQLQVVCYRLWQGLSDEKMQIDEQEIAHVGDVNQSLSDYYAERVAAVAGSTGVLERSIRDWFEHKLITEQGIRSQVLMGQQQSEELDNHAIFKLVDAHLVRADKRRGITWFELAHDRLVRPVRTNNEAWFQANLSLLQRQAALWQKDNRSEHLLLREQALQQAEEWAATHAAELTTVDNEFLEASQMVRQREQETRERQEQAIKLKVQARLANILRGLLALAMVAAVAAIFFAITAFNARDQATEASNQNATLAALNATNASYAQAQSTLAVGNAATADANAGTAQVASTIASAERATADAARLVAQAASTEAVGQRATAEYNADVADANAKEAEKQASLANSRQLAAQSSSYQDTHPDLAALLAIESYNSADTLEARSIMLSNLQHGLAQSIRPYGQPIPQQDKDVYGLALSPDGTHIAWGTSDGGVVLRNHRTSEVAWALRRHRNNKVYGIDFSPDGKQLASGALDGQVILWDVATGESTAIQVNRNIYDVAFRPNSNQLAAAAGDQIIIWDTSSLERLYALNNQTDVFSLDWSPDGAKLVAGGRDGTVKIWNPEKTIPDGAFDYHAGQVFGVDWSPDGQLIASGSEDGNIIIWDLARGRQLGEPLEGNDFSWVYSVSFSSDNKRLVSGFSDGEVLLWNVADQELIARLEPHEDIVISVAFSPVPGQLILASGGLDNMIKMTEILTQQPLSEPLGDGQEVAIAIGAKEDGTIQIARQSAAGLNVVEITPGSDPQETQLFSVPGSFTSAAFSPDGKQLALGDKDGNINILEAETGSQILTVSAVSTSPVYALAYNSDGGVLASSHCSTQPTTEEGETISFCTENEIRFWNVESGIGVRQPLVGHTDIIRSLAFDPLGRFLASGSADKSIWLWDLATDEQDGVPLERHLAGVTSLTFSPDGITLASGSADQSLILWDVDTHQPIGGQLVGATGAVLSQDFLTDGLSLISGASDGSILSWDVSLNSWIERLCDLAGRNLTDTEWQQFIPQEEYRKTCPKLP